MPIREHPAIGTVLMCDFSTGFKPPEMVKRRPVVVISPKIAARPGLCTVVCLSTSAPSPAQQYHGQIDIRPRLPPSLSSDGIWVKGDMVSVVGFHRLDFIRHGKDHAGRRIYHFSPVSPQNLKKIRSLVLAGIGLGQLTKHL